MLLVVVTSMSNFTVQAADTVDVGPFAVTELKFSYETQDANQPSLEGLMDVQVGLLSTPTGYKAAGGGQATHTVSLRNIGKLQNPKLYASAILSILNATRDYLTGQGLAGVIVQPDARDIDPLELKDLRPAGNQTLRIVIKAARIGAIRVLPAGEQKETNPTVASRITSRSPLQTGEAFRLGDLDNYLHRLNRHPGRRVDVAVAPGDAVGSLTVDYLLNENKAWFVFFQLSNTGTPSTNEWRERFGFVHNQLTGHDDILSVDYVTAGFTSSHAVIASYEAPFPGLDRVRWKVDGTWGTFDASEVGQADEEFNGDQWDAAAQIIVNVFQYRSLFIDVFAGARVQYVRVENETLATIGKDYFVLPFIGVSLEQYTELSSTNLSVSIEGNLSGLAGTDNTEIQKLGRSAVEEDFLILRWNMSHSVYLEPLFQSLFGDAEALSPTASLAHELMFSFRGQYTFDARVVPQLEQVAGGRYSVRGYDESVAAGDTALILSLEYRFHFPRVLAPQREPMNTPFGPFKYRPQEAYGRPDWDLVLRTFVDVGRTMNAGRLSFERDETLVGIGLGMELLIKKNVSIQLDWGIALNDAGVGSSRVSAGDSRVHLVFTLLY
ncbi:MAG: ShlB/FhaC/HecB family hemolysin secretion/activation protein [Phycisphaeraceae bacterium]